jgi:hypothetical protein
MLCLSEDSSAMLVGCKTEADIDGMEEETDQFINTP